MQNTTIFTYKEHHAYLGGGCIEIFWGGNPIEIGIYSSMGFLICLSLSFFMILLIYCLVYIMGNLPWNHLNWKGGMEEKERKIFKDF